MCLCQLYAHTHISHSGLPVTLWFIEKSLLGHYKHPAAQEIFLSICTKWLSQLQWLLAFTLIEKNNRYTSETTGKCFSLKARTWSEKEKNRTLDCRDFMHTEVNWSELIHDWSELILYQMSSFTEHIWNVSGRKTIDKHFNNWSLSILSCFGADLKKENKKPSYLWRANLESDFNTTL